MDIINPEANEVGRSGPYIHLPAVFMEREMFVSDVGIRTCLPKALWILTRCLGPLNHAVLMLCQRYYLSLLIATSDSFSVASLLCLGLTQQEWVCSEGYIRFRKKDIVWKVLTLRLIQVGRSGPYIHLPAAFCERECSCPQWGHEPLPNDLVILKLALDRSAARRSF